MDAQNIRNVCVVGAGNMGHQITVAAALAGYRVSCTDVDDEILKKAEKFADEYLPERVKKGKLSEEDAKAVRSRINFTSNLNEAAQEADLVIEAATEKLDVKRKIFSQLDSVCPPHTILTTNSSYIVSSRVADATSRPEKVCNMHFFNPALVMKTVEVVKGPHTAEETAGCVVEVCKTMNKIPALLHKEIDGFLVNRILSAIREEALYLYDMGIASYEDIDNAVVYALGHPMGPFKLMDLTGIDLAYDVKMERYRQTGDPKHKPSPVVVEKYLKKEWGKKTGKGFYSYND